MPDITELAAGRITGEHQLTIQLIRQENLPATNRTQYRGVIRVDWPTQQTVVSPDRFPEVAAQIVKLFATASTELAAIKARHRGIL
jgi:hypothetical protein